jgi:sugar/nucleoside kinase (ribokinase family)
MAADRLFDLVCFSYLADAQVLHVGAYPRPNGGAVVIQVAASIAADGPLAAVTASRLGLRTALISNAIGDDPAGQRLHAWLHDTGVDYPERRGRTGITPQITVVDDATTRTWFAALQHAYDELEHVSLDPLEQARLAYIDCYQVITTAAVRAITAAGSTPLMLNLGSDPVHDAIIAASSGRRIAVVQTGLDEAHADQAETVGRQVLDLLHPDTAVVTLGALGAIAVTRSGVRRAPAARVPVTHTHGAGAAFSAGYAHALLTGADVPAALVAGCTAGTRHCTSPAAPVPRRPPAALAA